MKLHTHNQLTAKTTAVILCALCVLLSGCSQKPSEDAASVQPSEKSSVITCFGTVGWRESRTLQLPFDVQLLRVEARNGQLISKQDVLFYIDYDEVLAQKTSLENQLRGLLATKNSYESDMTALQAQLMTYQDGVTNFDGHQVMEQLRTIAKNKGSTSKYNAARLTLLEGLRRFGLLDHYDPLLSYATAKDKFYYEKANPLLERIDQNFDTQLLQTQAQVNEKSSQLIQTDAEILRAQTDVDSINEFLAAQGYKNLNLSENGAVTIAEEGYMVDTIIVGPHDFVRANEPILSMINMDSMEIVCYVEEQLVRDIQVGNTVQLSLYSNSAVVEIGSVVYVSQKAILLNGETVVEVVMGYDGDAFLPGYNIVARIAPEKSK